MESTLSGTIWINASLERVFQALTRSDELRGWFAEYADVSLEHGRYDFWGRNTPETPARDAGRHQLLITEPGRGLRFDWTLHGVPTTVAFDLRPADSGTLLTVSHSGLPERADGEIGFDNYWQMTLESLRAWVERGRGDIRCDFSAHQQGDIQVAIDIDAPAETVFKVLTDPRELDRTIGHNAVVEPQVGGVYDYGWGEGPLKILELVPNERLSFSWKHEPDPDETVVTWTLTGSNGKTHLTLVHSGFADDRKTADYYLGWLEIMVQFKLSAELRERWVKPTLQRTAEPAPALTV